MLCREAMLGVGFFADPDGNTLELSWGQRVGLEVIAAGNAS